ncbi:MAG TPA: hypothetical protein OIM45_04975 [Clostridiaceae bacterium]|nr:hypothetical protein [Clostridiaceae bacterium]
MTKEEFKQGIHIIQQNYNTKFEQSKLKLYYENLKDISYDTYINNIKEHIKSNPFIPNIAQLRGNEQRKQFADYEQREYENIDFNKFYAN